jgi:hypothetical protein
VETLGARLGLSGHGRPYVDVAGHIEGSRRLAQQRIEATMAALAGDPQTALQIAPAVHDQPVRPENASWLLSETLCYLQHLEGLGQVSRHPDEDPVRWELKR